MSTQEENIKSFVVDTNVFIAAIKPYSGSSKSRSRLGETRTLSLLIKLIASEELELKGNSVLVAEYKRFTQELDSETIRLILKQLIEKMSAVELSDDSLNRRKPLLPATESADVVHAATCLETGGSSDHQR
jgi:predicted nucleic acid-binding protein